MDKEIAVYPYNKILSSQKKKELIHTTRQMNLKIKFYAEGKQTKYYMTPFL